MCIFEYNEELHEQTLREEGKLEGRFAPEYDIEAIFREIQ